MLPKGRLKSPAAIRHSKRRGMAPMEWIMVLPIFVAAWCCAMWIAGMMIRKAEITAIARAATDELRFDQAQKPKSQPFDFSAENEGRVGLEKETSFRFSSIMPEGSPAARHTIILNSWDYRQVRLDRLPDIDLTQKFALSGPPNALKDRLKGLQAAVRQIQSLFSSFRSLLQIREFPSLVTNLMPGLNKVRTQLGQLTAGGTKDGLLTPQATQAVKTAVDQKIAELSSGAGELSNISRLYNQIKRQQRPAHQVTAEANAEGQKQIADYRKRLAEFDAPFNHLEDAAETFLGIAEDTEEDPEMRLEQAVPLKTELKEAIEQIRRLTSKSVAEASPSEKGEDLVKLANLSEGTEDSNGLLQKLKENAGRMEQDQSSINRVLDKSTKAAVQKMEWARLSQHLPTDPLLRKHREELHKVQAAANARDATWEKTLADFEVQAEQMISRIQEVKRAEARIEPATERAAMAEKEATLAIERAKAARKMADELKDKVSQEEAEKLEAKATELEELAGQLEERADRLDEDVKKLEEEAGQREQELQSEADRFETKLQVLVDTLDFVEDYIKKMEWK